MKPSSNKRRVLLVGAGHANLEFIKSWRASDHELAEFTLITPHTHAIYSGLLPAYLRGEVGLDEMQIDLPSLADRHGFRLHFGKMRSLSVEHRHIVLADGSCREFDDLFINTGGQPPSAWQSTSTRCLHVRPLANFLELWEREGQEIQRIAVIGAGAAGIEIAASLVGSGDFAPTREVHLFESRDDLGLQISKHGRLRLRKGLQKIGVQLHFKAHFTGLPRLPELALGSSRLKFDLVLATTPTSPPVYNVDRREQTLSVDEQLRLQSTHADRRSGSHVWVTGDAVAESPWPRSGVSAVRQGQALRQLWRASVTSGAGGAIRKFPTQARPLKLQFRQLKLLRVGNQVFGLWGDRVLGFSMILRWLKSWIDRRYMRSFSRCAEKTLR
ncbi:MAG TPA: FAD-dependent oxidoreductase [Pseudobdellovibrionaceae bacterium]|nr:FAD-dependent oxidoreductase [Pseudobdellovibrionaceae bacterium]